MATFAPPPIMLRSTYPPGQPDLGAAPAPLGHKPQGVNEIEHPGTQLGTLFSGPIVSGPTPGINGAVGAARLTLCLQLDYSMGNFQLPIQFPGGSYITGVNAVMLQPGLMTAFITLGTEAGQGDICTVPLPAVGATLDPPPPVMAQLPLWHVNPPQLPFVMWINVTGNPTTATAGMAIILIDYVRVPAAWSSPA